MALSAKQEAFAREYIKDLNATQAAIRAGYSDKTANRQGPRLLSNAGISELIHKLKAERAERTETDSDYVLKRLREIDELDVLDIMQDDLMGFRPLSEWPKSWRTSINGIDVASIIQSGDTPIETIVKKIKWPDKARNLELIGKHVDVKAFEGEQKQDEAIGRIILEVASANPND